MKQAIISALTVALVGPLYAHEGHGMSGSHWHATDGWGFIALVVLTGVLIWLRRK